MGIIRNQLFEKKTSFHSKKRLKEFKRQKKNIHITYELAKL